MQSYVGGSSEDFFTPFTLQTKKELICSQLSCPVLLHFQVLKIPEQPSFSTVCGAPLRAIALCGPSSLHPSRSCERRYTSLCWLLRALLLLPKEYPSFPKACLFQTEDLGSALSCSLNPRFWVPGAPSPAAPAPDRQKCPKEVIAQCLRHQGTTLPAAAVTILRSVL